MTKDNALTLLADSTQAAERKAFSLEEMITCGECLRANPPTRNTCFYCAAPLPLSSGVAEDQQAAKIAGETGQRGYSVVVLPHENIALTGDALSEAAGFLRFKIDELAALLSMRQPLPLA